MYKRNINRIITETLNRYLMENIFPEEKDNNTDKEANEDEYDYIEDDDPSDDDDDFISDEEAKDLISRLKLYKHLLNVAALAKKVYQKTGHTPEGAQSQLRKKIEQETNDNGVPYKFTRREYRIIIKILDNLAK